ncbi:MAG: hypothetical protein LH614_12110 [Pyrinomonadaceae bacterium]|nr:hypothetical protein [Pyrinomonadaceae bacterium]
MKKDIRRQTFSKPEKPSDEDIKKLTDDESIVSPEPESAESAIITDRRAALAVENSEAEESEKVAEATEISTINTSNPFLLSRGQASEIGIEKTGYRLRSDFMDLLKLVKRMKKGHTLEAVLDDALNFYFENSEDGRKAVKQRQMLDSAEHR